jgi:hypothetical protein
VRRTAVPTCLLACAAAIGARIVLCGVISGYIDFERRPGIRNHYRLIIRRATMRGFFVFDHLTRPPCHRRPGDVGSIHRSTEFCRAFVSRAPAVAPGSLPSATIAKRRLLARGQQLAARVVEHGDSAKAGLASSLPGSSEAFEKTPGKPSGPL